MRVITIVASGLVFSGCAAGGAPVSPADLDAEDRAALMEVLAEEDRRPALDDAAALRAGLGADSALVRAYAVRGIGRLEEPEALDLLLPALADPEAGVRAAAASAIAQSVGGADAGAAADMLRAALSDETDPAVRGTLAQALGRLRAASPAALENRQAILVGVAAAGAPLETIVAALRGLETLVRTNRAVIELTAATRQRLGELVQYGRRGGEGFVEEADGAPPDAAMVLTAARVRRLALAALDAAGVADADLLETALYDPDTEVRRLAAAATGRVEDPDRQLLLVQIGLGDDSSRVRYEALRWYGRRFLTTEGCAPIVAAIEDADDHVALHAIDLLAVGCRGSDSGEADAPPVAAILEELAASLPNLPTAAELATSDRDGINPPVVDAAAPPVAWHRGSHALVALAGVDAGAAAALVPAHAAHPTWQVRMYAARAAATVGAVDTLEQLVDDPVANVAEAALRFLDANNGASADGAAVAALSRADYQLLITAANLLEGSQQPGAVGVLADALARVTAERRETSRDPRRALLRRIGELGGAEDAGLVRPYLQDFDPQIADQAAEILLAWTGEPATPSPQPLPPRPFPSIEELIALENARARVEMRGGGSFEIELHAFEAPTNVARFARQAREGYFEGLTFHRVVPNFVIQGGSPGANEYVGDGPFSRDEITDRSHLRGTVGISTRGRDTGDSQIFVNLIDNVRLDFNYTIIGTVVEGMEVVDGVLEGATIERVTIAPQPAAR